MASRLSAARTTISLANSMPEVRRSERKDGVAANAAQAAMEIADAGAEEHPPDQAEHGIAEIAVQERHGAGAMPPAKAVAHHEVGAFAQRCATKQLEVREKS